MKHEVPIIYLEQQVSNAGEVRLVYDATFENTDVNEQIVVIRRSSDTHSSDALAVDPASDSVRVLTVFYQKAMDYGKYSMYVSKHGCAVCSLTTMLRGWSDKYRDLRPDETITRVEKTHFSKLAWYANYLRPMPVMMPVSLYGISCILSSEGIPNRYVRSFTDNEAAAEIKSHLLSGKPVIIETSRMRRHAGKIADRRDNKYTGSNHTQILLGMTPAGKVVFADSADRKWSGSRQRLKEAPLEDMIDYMFPQKFSFDTHKYFPCRSGTGGYILVDALL